MTRIACEGLQELAKIASDPSLLPAVRVEAIMALNAGYFFHINRLILGPEAARRRAVEGLRLEDPVLADISGKARRMLLDMPLGERRKALSAAASLH